jgi:hypothetical protein
MCRRVPLGPRRSDSDQRWSPRAGQPSGLDGAGGADAELVALNLPRLFE